MKGIIFNLLEAAVTKTHGEEVWDALLQDAKLTGVYTSLGSYPDEEFGRLVAMAAVRFELSPDKILNWFGREAMTLLVDRYPAFFRPHSATRPFLMTLNDIIHPEVRKLYPGAEVPTFDISDAEGGALLVGYQSTRRACALAVGFMEGAALHYGERVQIEHQECMHRGDPRCLMHVAFRPLA